jgi:hypothetical protein
MCVLRCAVLTCAFACWRWQFDDDQTPLHLLGGATNIYGEISLALKALEWRKPGLVAVASKLATSAGTRTPVKDIVTLDPIRSDPSVTIRSRTISSSHLEHGRPTGTKTCAAAEDKASGDVVSQPESNETPEPGSTEEEHVQCDYEQAMPSSPLVV